MLPASWKTKVEISGLLRLITVSFALRDGKTIVNMAEKKVWEKTMQEAWPKIKAGNMWFTMKNGICKYDGKTFTEYTPKDGLGGTEFWGIYIEQSGIIWITARGSTTRFDPSLPLPNPKAFTVFTPADGIKLLCSKYVSR
jgi:ligand-binding sensor domain-containing protein